MTRANFLAPDFKGNVVTGVGNPAGDTDAINRAWALANKGVTILTGTVAPIDSVGAVGNYYLDTNNRILYGPKVDTAGQNLLTANQASVETDLTGFTAVSSTLARVTSWSSHGTASLQVTATAGAYQILFQLPRIAVTEGVNYTRSMNVRFAAGSRALFFEYEFQNSSFTNVSSGTGSAVTGNPTGVYGTDSRVAPAGAAYIVCKVMAYSDGQVGDVFNIDQMGLWSGSSTTWTLPAGGGAWPVTLKSVPPGGSAAQVLAKVDADDYDVTWATPATGSVILSGTATPTGATGNTGEFYLDADDNVLYGPKAALTATSAHTTQTPVAYMSVSNEAGLRYTFATAGFVSALRYYRLPTSSQTSRTMKLWSNAGVLLASASTSGESGSGWFEVGITPIAVTSGQSVVVSYDATGANNPRAFYETTYPLTNGSVTAVAGRYNATTGLFPATEDAGYDFFVDVAFTLATAWPIALKSGGSVYTADLGAVTANTPVTVTHGLGTFDVFVQVIEKNSAGAGAGVGQFVFPTIAATSTSAVQLTFAETKAANLYRVIVSPGGGGTGGGGSSDPSDESSVIGNRMFG